MSRPLDSTCANDPHYRYQRPFVTIRHTNSNQTFLENIDDVCKAIFRGKKLLFAFLSLSLATSTNTKKNFITGVHMSNSIESQIDLFVTKYVLCSACCNPETNIKIKSSHNVVYLKCQACGSRTYLSSSDKIAEKLLKSSKNFLK